MDSRGAKFFSLIHPRALVARSASVGAGVVVCPFATVSANVTLGDFAMLNLYASCGHDSQVGRYGILSPYATLNGFAVMDDEVFLATHATVTLAVRVGYQSIVSANSVVMRSVPPKSLVIGVPGKNWPYWTKP